MQGTFHQYALTRALTIKHSHATYLASPSNDPERQVHLTVFAACLFPFPHDREKLLHKGREIQALEHPYLLPILDMGIEEGQPFVVREYLPEGSLRSQLLNLRSGRLSLRAALTIVLQVGEALAYAHTHRVLHRNLKLGNILLDAHSHALLTDFSLVTGTDAILRDQATEEGAFCYLAPEQLAGTCHARSDQYALGCLTYELITGQVPFAGQRLTSLMAHPSQVGPLPLSEMVADLPPSLEAAVLKTLAKDPAERFVDCSLFLDVIRSVLFETALGLPIPISERPLSAWLPEDERADVQLALASQEEQEADVLMSAPASSVSGLAGSVQGGSAQGTTPTHGRTTSWLAKRLDRSEPSTRQAAGSKRKPIVLALVLLVVVASIASAFWLSEFAKPGTSTDFSNKGIRQIHTGKKNVASKSPTVQTATPSVQTTPPPATQPPVQITLPATQTPVQTIPLPATPTATPAPLSPANYEAEAPENTVTNGAQILSCWSCSGGYRVGYLGWRSSGTDGFLRFNNVNKQSAGSYTLTVYYANGATYSRDEYINVNGRSVIVFSGYPTGSFSTFTPVQITVSLNAGNNTLMFYNSQSAAPDIDKIVI